MYLIPPQNMISSLKRSTSRPGHIVGFQKSDITWEDITIPMREPNTTIEDGYLVQESDLVHEANKRTSAF